MSWRWILASDNYILLRFAAVTRKEANWARQVSLSYETYLQEQLIRECEECRHKRITLFLMESRVPLKKGLEAFDKFRLLSRISGLLNTLLVEEVLVVKRDLILPIAL